MGYLKETLSEKELFQLTYDKGKSQDSVQVLKSSLANFEYFTKDQLDKTRLQVLDDSLSLWFVWIFLHRIKSNNNRHDYHYNWYNYKFKWGGIFIGCRTC